MIFAGFDVLVVHATIAWHHGDELMADALQFGLVGHGMLQGWN